MICQLIIPLYLPDSLVVITVHTRIYLYRAYGTSALRGKCHALKLNKAINSNCLCMMKTLLI